VWNSYFDSGMPWSQAGYKRGVPHGDYVTYHPNGETAIEGTLEDGVKVGMWRFYDEQGVQLRAVAGVEL
jgi:antitoxin component YwqK of YwqJK toxin-antitoxin module